MRNKYLIVTKYHVNIVKYHPNIVKYHVNIVKYHHCLTPDRRVELGTQRVATFLLFFFLKSGVAPCTITRVRGSSGAVG